MRQQQNAPESIRQSGPDELEIVWSDGHVSRYPVVYLRRQCRCASCVHEWTGERIVQADAIPEDVRPLSMERVGRYAIQLDWSDGHRTGIYTFEHLRNICPCERCRGVSS